MQPPYCNILSNLGNVALPPGIDGTFPPTDDQLMAAGYRTDPSTQAPAPGIIRTYSDNGSPEATVTDTPDPIIRQLQIQYVTTTQMLCGLIGVSPVVDILTRQQIADGIQSITDPLMLGRADTLEGWLIYLDHALKDKTNTTNIDDAMRGYAP